MKFWWNKQPHKEEEPVGVFRLSTIKQASDLLVRLDGVIKEQQKVIEKQGLRMEKSEALVKCLENEVGWLRKRLEEKK